MDGMEVECSVLGHSDPLASRPGEIVLQRGDGWYDYEAKYESGGMELIVPGPRCRRRRSRRCGGWPWRPSRSSAAPGMARVDFFVEDDRVLVNELNTIPGFTSTSVYAKLLEADGIAYSELLDRLVG